MYFLNYFFNDPDGLISPVEAVSISSDIEEFKENLVGLDYKQGHKLLNNFVRDRGENIPPLINNYMSLSPTMRSFGTVLNQYFGEVEETMILVKIEDIYAEKKSRYIDSYQPSV
jgi:hypothetical protein